MIALRVLVLVTVISLSLQEISYEDFQEIYRPVFIKEGDNINFPSYGSEVTVHYTGTFTDGRKFDSSVDRNLPFTFKIQEGQVIKCWDDVVSRMSLGEMIRVTCPSSTAYGERGAGDIIPPNTDLIFQIELLSWK